MSLASCGPARGEVGSHDLAQSEGDMEGQPAQIHCKKWESDSDITNASCDSVVARDAVDELGEFSHSLICSKVLSEPQLFRFPLNL